MLYSAWYPMVKKKMSESVEILKESDTMRYIDPVR
jgi:hypothetical protein